MEEYKVTVWVKPAYLGWVIECMRNALEVWGINLHNLSIGHARRSNPYRTTAHQVIWVVSGTEPQLSRMLDRILNKLPGVLS